jgi:hypothetical protein
LPSASPIDSQGTPNCSARPRQLGRLPIITAGSALICPSRMARKSANGVSGRNVTQMASRGRAARSSADQTRIESFFSLPISTSALRISASCAAGKSIRSSIAKRASSSWSYIWISAMFAPWPVT